MLANGPALMILAGRTMLAIQPKVFGRTNERSGSIVRPRMQFTAIGIPYAISSITTDDEIIALNALLWLVIM